MQTVGALCSRKPMQALVSHNYVSLFELYINNLWGACRIRRVPSCVCVCVCPQESIQPLQFSSGRLQVFGDQEDGGSCER